MRKIIQFTFLLIAFFVQSFVLKSQPKVVNDTIEVYISQNVEKNILANDSFRILNSLVLLNNGKGKNQVEFFKGKFIYYASSYVGLDTIRYKICDINGCDSGSIFVKIKPRTFKSQNDTFSVCTGCEISSSAYLNNDYEILDRSPIKKKDYYAVVLIPPKHEKDYYIEYFSDASNFYYKPESDFVGLDSVVYELHHKESKVCDTSTIYISITNVAPIALNDTITKHYNKEFEVFLLENDSDADNNIISYSIIKEPNNGLTYSRGQGSILGYIPNYSFTGRDSVVYKLCDEVGGIYCDTATIIINVINLPPSTDTIMESIEDPILGEIYGFDFSGYDPEGDVDKYNNYTIVKQPVYGSVTMNVKGGAEYTVRKMLVRDSFSYRFCDNWGSCSINQVYIEVGNNSPPLCKNSIEYLDRNTIFVGDFFNNFDDVNYNIDSNSISVLAYPKNGVFTYNSGNFIYEYKPNFDFIGKDSVVIKICDLLGECGSAKIVFQIKTTTLYAPKAINDFVETYTDISGSVAANDFDLDGDLNLNSFQIVKGATKGNLTFKKDGSYNYQIKNLYGIDSIKYKVCDYNGYCDSAFLIIKIKENFAPDAVNDAFVTTRNVPVRSSLKTNDFDANNNLDIFSYQVVKNSKNGVIQLNNNGNFVYTPNLNFVGKDTFSYKIQDLLGLKDTAFAFFTINQGNNSVNNAPVAENDFFKTKLNTSLSNSVATNDFDSENNLNINSFEIIKPFKKGDLSFNNSGSFTYKPNPNYLGLDTASYSVCDLGNLCDTAILVIFTSEGNNIPNIENDSFVTKFNTTFLGSVASNDFDLDANFNPNSYSIIKLPSNGNLKFFKDGKFIYTPQYNFVGRDTFTYQACDLLNFCKTAQTMIHVQAGVLTGKVFIDENANNILDNDESGYPNVFLKINNEIDVITKNDGSYQFNIDTVKAYNIKPNFNNSLFTINPLSKTVSSTQKLLQIIDNQNFSIKPNRNFYDLALDVTQGEARPGYESMTVITFRNVGNRTIDAAARLDLDNNLTYISSSENYNYNDGKQYNWLITNLKPFENRRIAVFLKTAVTTPLRSIVTIKYEGFTSGSMDNDTSNNRGISTIDVRGSFDPNDITVDRKELKQSNIALKQTVPLTYTIRFQNTGNAEAYRVEVVDTISNKLDVKSIEMLATSHPYEMQIVSETAKTKPFSIVKWIFNNINLQDSTTKEACSHGFIKYRLKNNPLQIDFKADSILNKAAIYFDFNQPIITNLAKTQFLLVSPVVEIENLKIAAYPNPTNGLLNIVFEKEVNATIEVCNNLGQIFKYEKIIGKQGQIDLGSLNSGLYFLSIKTKELTFR
jgi:uncharacterized repeat protein (TIGR01451 family)